VVQEGESLSSIARSVYRRASRWPEIARANGLSEPFRIRAGQTLTIP
jgi:nucleoid-associated protein YgaU